jgi:hypothetical protein
VSKIIDETYFEKGVLYIPNNKDINASPVGSPTIQSELGFFIDEYSRKFLIDTLGIVVYKELQIALTKLPFVESTTENPVTETADQKWVDLVNGKDYQDSNEVERHWEGLRGFNKVSVIALFVYLEYFRNYNETFTKVGVVKNEAKNAKIINATPKFINAHLKFIEKYQGDTEDSLPTAIINRFGSLGTDWYGVDQCDVSLFRYILDMNELDKTNFPYASFKFIQPLNSLGI